MCVCTCVCIHAYMCTCIDGRKQRIKRSDTPFKEKK